MKALLALIASFLAVTDIQLRLSSATPISAIQFGNATLKPDSPNTFSSNYETSTLPAIIASSRSEAHESTLSDIPVTSSTVDALPALMGREEVVVVAESGDVAKSDNGGMSQELADGETVTVQEPEGLPKVDDAETPAQRNEEVVEVQEESAMQQDGEEQGSEEGESSLEQFVEMEPVRPTSDEDEDGESELLVPASNKERHDSGEINAHLVEQVPEFFENDPEVVAGEEVPEVQVSEWLEPPPLQQQQQQMREPNEHELNNLADNAANGVSAPWHDVMLAGLPPSMAYNWQFLMDLTAKLRSENFHRAQDAQSTRPNKGDELYTPRLKYLLSKVQGAPHPFQGYQSKADYLKQQHVLKSRMHTIGHDGDGLTWALRRAL